MGIDPIKTKPGPVDSQIGLNSLADGATGEGPARGRSARFAGSRRQAFVQLSSVLIGVIAITLYIQFGPRPPIKQRARVPELSTPSPAQAEPVNAVETNPTPAESPASVPKVVAATVTSAAPLPVINKDAVSAAEAVLDAASRDRARADHRADELSRRLAIASSQAALEAAKARKLAFVVRDPSTRIVQASTHGGFVRGERDKLEKELSSLRRLPRPKSISILSKSPVARPATSDEFHFELKRNRISFINLNRLLELTKADAQVRIRMGDRQSVISSKVGPAGSFSLAYELGRAAPGGMDELIERKSLRFDLRSWEIIPDSDNRGETYESIKNPISEFSRTINQMNPARVTVTLWIYPDSFSLYRRLREDLTEQGFSVAARPLPEGMSIRGSPLGTQSAAQ